MREVDKPELLTITPNQCRAAREMLGWKQEELAKRSEVALATIGSFERGDRMPYKSTMKAIKLAFEENGISFENNKYSSGIRLITKNPEN